MRIDGQRARIDAGTALVPVVVLTGWAVWSLLTGLTTEWTVRDVVGIWAWLLGMGVGPQVVQAVVGQLLFRRVSLPAAVRGVIMVAVWWLALLLAGWLTFGMPTPWMLYFAVLILPLLVLTRLGVRAVALVTAQ